MKQCLFIACVVASTMIRGGFVFADPTEVAMDAETTRADVRDNIAAFQQGGNMEPLLEAQRLLDLLGQQWKEDPGLIRPEVLRLRLEFLEACFQSREKAYNLEDPPVMYVNVPPPQLMPGLMAGMKPEDIKDPDARKSYEAALAENARRKAKFSREKTLQDFIDSGLRGIQGHLNLSKELGTLKSDIKIVKETLKNPDLMKKVQEEILSGFRDENGVPLSK